MLSRTFSLVVVLAVLWLLLSGYFDQPLLLVMGALSVVFVALIARRMDVVDREGHPIHLGIGGLAYWPWLVLQIAKSSIDLAKVLLRRRMPIHPSLITVRATQRTELGRVVLANSITLTPGTVTITLEGEELTVHCLTRAAASGWEESEMNRRVTDLERRS